MLGLVLLYWIGKYFYQLAEEFDKNKWAFAVLGIITYYVGILLFGFVFGIVAEIISPGYVDTFNEILLGLIALPFGILGCYILYKYLEINWKEKRTLENPSIEEIGKS